MDAVPNTYFEFTLGYAALWIVFFGAVLFGLWQIRKLSEDLATLDSARNTLKDTKPSE